MILSLRNHYSQIMMITMRKKMTMILQNNGEQNASSEKLIYLKYYSLVFYIYISFVSNTYQVYVYNEKLLLCVIHILKCIINYIYRNQPE